MPYVIAIGFVFIIGSLAFALFFMMKDRSGKNRMVTALAMRVGFSIALFLIIMLSWRMGWIHPTGTL